MKTSEKFEAKSSVISMLENQIEWYEDQIKRENEDDESNPEYKKMRLEDYKYRIKLYEVGIEAISKA